MDKYYIQIKNELINNEITKQVKNYSIKLTNELDKKYNITLLKRIRQFYLVIQKGATLSHQLSWSHYCELFPVNNTKKINYYIFLTLNNNLSIRELRSKIKNNEYERLPDETKIKLKRCFRQLFIY